MSIVQILKDLSSTRSNLEKLDILEREYDNQLLKSVLYYAYNPFKVFNVVKVPKTTNRSPIGDESEQFASFFSAADKTEKREVTGNAAVKLMSDVFSASTSEVEDVMRAILKKHLNVGISETTINKVWKEFIPTFDVALAHIYEEKRASNVIAIEPKLDGVRCISIVNNGQCTMFSRAGKSITNFIETVGAELIKLGDGIYDGEIMSEDFLKLMSQIHRKVDVNVKKVKYFVFDWLPLGSFQLNQIATIDCQKRREILEDLNINSNCKYVELVHRDIIEKKDIKKFHDLYVSQGYEGAMIKDLTAKYSFGRTYHVMKLKDFFDIDLRVVRLEAGKGKLSNTLGKIYVDFKGNEVGVGSGFTDDLRDEIWANPEKYIGSIVEVRYQEETADSLRFPTFRRFRPEKMK